MIDEKSEAPKEQQAAQANSSLPELAKGGRVCESAWLTPMPLHVVAQYIDTALECVMESLPPDTKSNPLSRVNIRGALLDGRIQAWLVLGKFPPDTKVYLLGIGSTKIIGNELSGEKELLLHTIFSYGILHPSCYVDFFNSIKDYAKQQKCVNIVAFAANPVVWERAAMVGMDTSWRYCRLEIK